MTEQVQENAMDEQIKEVSFRFREVFDKSYS